MTNIRIHKKSKTLWVEGCSIEDFELSQTEDSIELKIVGRKIKSKDLWNIKGEIGYVQRDGRTIKIGFISDKNILDKLRPEEVECIELKKWSWRHFCMVRVGYVDGVIKQYRSPLLKETEPFEFITNCYQIEFIED